MNNRSDLRPPAKRDPSRTGGTSFRKEYGYGSGPASAAGGRTARRVGEQNAAIPRAPRERRNPQSGSADRYDAPVEQPERADLRPETAAEPEPEHVSSPKAVDLRKDDELTVVDLPPEFDEVPVYTEPPRRPSVPEPRSVAQRRPEFDRSRRAAPAPRRIAPQLIRRKRSRKKKNNRTALILLLVLLLLICVCAVVLNFYSLVGGEFVSRDVTSLDVSNWDVPTTLGLSRLDRLEYLDMRNNDISIREYSSLRKRIPDCDIVWDVPVSGGVTVCNTVSDADISDSSGIKIGKLSKAIPYISSLSRLNVSGCGLDDEQLLALEQNMNGLDIVWNVDVFGNDVRNDVEELILTGKSGIKLDELAQKLVSFDHLRRVELTGCGLPEKELGEFAAAHPSLGCAWQVEICGQTVGSDCTELRLEATEEQPVDNISALSSLYKLHTLYISGGTFEDISPIADLPSLRYLTLNKCGLTDISSLASLNKLKFLDLSSNSIEAVNAISGMSSLEELHLNHNQITDIAPLSGLSSLRVLNLQDNKLTTTAGFGNVPCLEELSLRKNLLKGTDSVEALLSITSLKGLDMQQNKFLNKEEKTITKSFKEQLPDCTVYIWQ